MRSRDMELEAPPESESAGSSPSPAPPRRTAGNLSSMVVKPSLSGGGGSDLDIAYTADDRRRDSPLPLRRRDSPQDLHYDGSPASVRRRVGSPRLHRRESPPGLRRRYSPSFLRRRVSPLDFHRRRSPPFRSRSERFHNDPGSISPLHRLRVEGGYHEPSFGQLGAPRFGRGMRGRGGGRFRDERIGGTYDRGIDSSTRAMSPVEGEFIHRNDPNLSPREGDWICRNPSCGNLNFARRIFCNNCNKYRYDEPYGSDHSPRRAYDSPPPIPKISPRLPGLLVDRGPRRDLNGYRSPPRAWDTVDSRDFRTSFFRPSRGGKLLGPMRRDRPNFRNENFKERGSDWAISSDWERRDRIRDTLTSDRRGLDRHSPLPHDRWIQESKDRSRSPIIPASLPRVSYADRGRDVRRYDEPYRGSERANLNAGRGGRSYGRGTSRGRIPHIY
ncbi:hypothetical protein AXF42_Ash001150 [Apostasia shenzhenica]|uniref:RanBP2-type domain-containing protein n=1 Tax=Apostasia shenzhenica TaxID=1088818 RepID=A0A2I0AU50_9ASPA|nr:hypothetical protein AXF42_Ash001150 [Apostasia shenzhenica]